MINFVKNIEYLLKVDNKIWLPYLFSTLRLNTLYQYLVSNWYVYFFSKKISFSFIGTSVIFLLALIIYLLLNICLMVKISAGIFLTIIITTVVLLLILIITGFFSNNNVLLIIKDLILFVVSNTLYALSFVSLILLLFFGSKNSISLISHSLNLVQQKVEKFSYKCVQTDQRYNSKLEVTQHTHHHINSSNSDNEVIMIN